MILYVLLICLIGILSSFGVTDSRIEMHKFAIRDVPQIYIIYISITRLCPPHSNQMSAYKIHPICEDEIWAFVFLKIKHFENVK